jgi:hypothetical protein
LAGKAVFNVPAEILTFRNSGHEPLIERIGNAGIPVNAAFVELDFQDAVFITDGMKASGKNTDSVHTAPPYGEKIVVNPSIPRGGAFFRRVRWNRNRKARRLK